VELPGLLGATKQESFAFRPGRFNEQCVLTTRDILWVFIGRDIYRMLVIEQGWTSEEYEKWLAELLVNTLIVGKKQT
jgi:hypothetical protein